MRALPIDMPDVCIALSGEGGSLKWFLDTETGNTLLLNAEYDPHQNDGIAADEVERRPERFKRIPESKPSEMVGDMQAYAAQLADQRLKESLELALAAPHPERRFRAALGWLPEELAKWHAFRQGQLEARARAWLMGLGLKPEN